MANLCAIFTHSATVLWCKVDRKKWLSAAVLQNGMEPLALPALLGPVHSVRVPCTYTILARTIP